MKTKLFTLIIGATLLFGCTATGVDTETIKPECSFEYGKSIESSIVLPVLKLHAGDLYKYYNYDDPIIRAKGKNIQIRLISSKTIDGYRLLDEETLVIEIEPCNKKLRSSYWQRAPTKK